jgi:hypothetical protein
MLHYGTCQLGPNRSQPESATDCAGRFETVDDVYAIFFLFNKMLASKLTFFWKRQ